MLFHRSTKKTNSHENLISLTLASGSSSKSSTPQSSKSSTAAAAAAAAEQDKDKDNDVIENWYISKSKAKSKSTNNNIICCNMMPTFLSTITSYMNSTRLMVLIVLCLQNSLFTVLRRYSQGVLKEDYSKVRFMLCYVTIYIYIYIYYVLFVVYTYLLILTYLLTIAFHILHFTTHYYYSSMNFY